MASTKRHRAPHSVLLEAIRAELAAHADPVKAVSQQRYMKSAMPYWGLTLPELRAVTRRVLAEPEHRIDTYDAWEATIRELWDAATHREERYVAIAIARHPMSKPFRADGALGLYRYLVETGAWWDLVDEVATHLVRDELLADPARVSPTMRSWARDPDQWVRRTAILCQVGARERVDTSLLADVIVPNLERAATSPPGGKQDFFIRKALGWALRDASYRRPDWVRAFVADHRDDMAPLTIREALKALDRQALASP